MSDPRLEHEGEICYFTDTEGTRFRVYDVLFGNPTPHKKTLVPLKHPSANTRYFVREHGETRAYTFSKQEPRVFDPERLTKQLAGAGFVATTPNEIKALKPT
jgi:hypothetical protein